MSLRKTSREVGDLGITAVHPWYQLTQTVYFHVTPKEILNIAGRVRSLPGTHHDQSTLQLVTSQP
jgi:hypothetical protein